MAGNEAVVIKFDAVLECVKVVTRAHSSEAVNIQGEMGKSMSLPKLK
jgi:hypothetical protein